MYACTLRTRGFPQKYISFWLKTRLENHKIGQKPSFTQMQTDKIWESCALVQSAAANVDEAMTYAFNLANKQQVNNLAHSFKHFILKSFEESQPLLWPPTPEYYDSVSVEKHSPKNVMLFLKVLISCSECHNNERLERLIGFISWPGMGYNIFISFWFINSK